LVFLSISSLFSQQIAYLSPEVIDVGNVVEGEVVQGEIKFINNATEQLKINNIRTSCGCTAAKPDKEAYSPGDTVVINYTLKTRGFKGVLKKDIRIDLEGLEPSNISFTIQANVITMMKLIPDYLNLGQLPVNPDTTITVYFEIQNDWDEPIKITKITQNRNILKITPLNAEIPPHKSQLFRIDYQPDQVGRQDTRITIDTNYDAKPRLYLPVFINISS
jgi:hypothetical protein